MRKYVAFLMAFVFAAISAALASDVHITADQIPANAKSFIKENFPGTTIIKAKKDYDDGEIEVRLSNGVKIEFRASGEWKEIDGNGNDLSGKYIPAKILSNVRANHPGVMIEEVHRHFGGHYEIELINDVKLYYNQDGTPAY